MAPEVVQPDCPRDLQVTVPPALLAAAADVCAVLSVSLSRYALSATRAALAAGGADLPPLTPEPYQRGRTRRPGTTWLRIAAVPPALLAALAHHAGPGGIGAYVRAALRAQLLRDGAELPPGA